MSFKAWLWDHSYRSSPSWELGAADELLVATLEHRHVTPGRTLDVGCGTGDTAIELACRGWDVTAVDISTRALVAARAKADLAGAAVRFICADVATWQPESQFDLIVDRGLLMSVAGERARRRYVRFLDASLSPMGAMFSAQWVLATATAPAWIVLGCWPFAVLRVGEIEDRFGESYAIEVVAAKESEVDDRSMRRLGLRTVMETSYWIRRYTTAASDSR